MKKRFLSFLTTLCLVLTSATTALAAEPVEENIGIEVEIEDGIEVEDGELDETIPEDKGQAEQESWFKAKYTQGARFYYQIPQDEDQDTYLVIGYNNDLDKVKYLGETQSGFMKVMFWNGEGWVKATDLVECKAMPHEPVGEVEVSVSDGVIRAKGWCVDRDDFNAKLDMCCFVGLYNDLDQMLEFKANKYVAGFEFTHPGLDAYHGFEIEYDVTQFAAPGEYLYHIQGYNIGDGRESTDLVNDYITVPDLVQFFVGGYFVYDGDNEKHLYDNLVDYGSFDVYLNGQQVADDVNTFVRKVKSGTRYEISDVHGKNGYMFSGFHEGTDIGTIIRKTDVRIELDKDNLPPYIGLFTFTNVSPSGFTASCVVKDDNAVGNTFFYVTKKGEPFNYNDLSKAVKARRQDGSDTVYAGTLSIPGVGVYQVVAQSRDRLGNSGFGQVQEISIFTDDYLKITKQPLTSYSVKEGEKINAEILAEGNDLRYQWQYSKDNGATWSNINIQSAVTNALSMTATTANNGMYIRCAVTNKINVTQYSNSAKLVVGVGKPQIVTQPESITVNEGETAPFTVIATGSDLRYQWQVKKPGSTTWEDSTASSAQTAYFKLVAAYNRSGYAFRCVITDKFNQTITSNEATLTVIVERPEIVTQPVSVTVNEGNKAYFSIVAKGQGLQYQWSYSTDKGVTWKPSTASCATTTNFNITGDMRWNGMMLKCDITDTKGHELTSNIVKLTVLPDLTVPKIVTPPTSVVAGSGAKATFKVVCTGENLTYKWYYSMDKGATYKASTAASASTDTFSITAAEKWNGMWLKCRISNSNGTAVTSAVKLTVSAKPVIVTQPANVTAGVGAKANFKVVASGDTLRYQWYYSMDKGTTWKVSSASCAKTDTFTITASDSWNGMLLKCKITDKNGGSVTTTGAKLTVTQPPVITAQPRSVTAASGTKAQFFVTASGDTLSYQWYYSVDNGATYKVSTASCAKTSMFTITAAKQWNNMKLKCVITDKNGGKVTSVAATLTVK